MIMCYKMNWEVCTSGLLAFVYREKPGIKMKSSVYKEHAVFKGFAFF